MVQVEEIVGLKAGINWDIFRIRWMPEAESIRRKRPPGSSTDVCGVRGQGEELACYPEC